MTPWYHLNSWRTLLHALALSITGEIPSEPTGQRISLLFGQLLPGDFRLRTAETLAPDASSLSRWDRTYFPDHCICEVNNMI